MMKTPEALLDTLRDLKHDLGQHLQLPLSLLPREADARAVQRAACEALQRTRRGQCGGGDCSARRLWNRFLFDAGDAVQTTEGFSALEDAVNGALAWEQRLSQCDSTTCKDSVRKSIAQDFGKVSECIGQLISEVTNKRR